MKRTATLLFCLLCLLLSGCGKEQAADVLEPLPVKQVNSLLYHNDSTTLRFTNDNEKWVWADGEDFPLDDSTIREILDQLPDILAIEPEAGTTDLSACGLAEPTRYLTVGSGEETRTIYFGAQATNSTWYMRRAESSDIYRIPDEFMQLLDKDIYDLAILPSLPELTEDLVTFIGVSRSEENYSYLLHADSAWKFNGKDVADTAKKILSEFEDMKLERCVDYFPADGVSELCGLTEGVAPVTVKYTNSVGTESELVLKVGALMESGKDYYVTVGDGNAIYSMPKQHFNTLLSLLT